MIWKDKGFLKTLWGAMFVMCALLGFVPEQEGANRWLLFFISLLVFVPPALLLWQCRQTRDRKTLRLILLLSLVSLVSTTVLMVVNYISVLFPEGFGNAVNWILVIVSTPAFCSHMWFVSLFLWAAILWCSILFLQECKKSV